MTSACRSALHVDLRPGSDAYAFAWMAAPDRMHRMFVTITETGPGNQGVLDSGDGPPFCPSNHQTVVDPSPPTDSDIGS